VISRFSRDSQWVAHLARFGIVGAFNTVLGLLCIFIGLHYLELGDVEANLFGYAVGFTVSYGLHRSWTFRHEGPALRSLIRFGLVILVAYGSNLGAMMIAHRYAGLNVYLAQTIGVLVYVTMSFFGSRHFAFRQA
tara:strand:- start:13389 stop:13793 length:405 start_codon:yes stop_codon:yes gene_type:complete